MITSVRRSGRATGAGHALSGHLGMPLELVNHVAVVGITGRHPHQLRPLAAADAHERRIRRLVAEVQAARRRSSLVRMTGGARRRDPPNRSSRRCAAGYWRMSARVPASAPRSWTGFRRIRPARPRSKQRPCAQQFWPHIPSSSAWDAGVACHDDESAFHVTMPLPTKLGAENWKPARGVGLEIDRHGSAPRSSTFLT